MHTNSWNKSDSYSFNVCQSKQRNVKYQQYEKGEILGQGGFASCYLATRIADQKQVAMKIIKLAENKDKGSSKDHHHRKNHAEPKKLSDEQKAYRQVKILRMCDHHTIVKYQTHFKYQDEFYIIMEYCKYGSFGDMLKKRKKITEIQARYFVVQMVQALKYLKSRRIIHRDLKPANYLLSEDLRLKIADFGLATIVDQNFYKNKNTCGTPNYISPQMLEKKQYSYEVDLWSIGVILYTMLYGIAPFETKNKDAKQTYDKIKKCDYNLHDPQISEQARQLIKKILVLDPKKRIPLDQILNHKFIRNFSIPQALLPTFRQRQPNKHFIMKFSANKSQKFNNSYKKMELQSQKVRITKRILQKSSKSSSSSQNVTSEEQSQSNNRSQKSFQSQKQLQQSYSQQNNQYSSSNILSKAFQKSHTKYSKSSKFQNISPSNKSSKSILKQNASKRITIQQSEYRNLQRLNLIENKNRHSSSSKYQNKLQSNNKNSHTNSLKQDKKRNLSLDKKNRYQIRPNTIGNRYEIKPNNIVKDNSSRLRSREIEEENKKMKQYNKYILEEQKMEKYWDIVSPKYDKVQEKICSIKNNYKTISLPNENFTELNKNGDYISNGNCISNSSYVLNTKALKYQPTDVQQVSNQNSQLQSNNLNINLNLYQNFNSNSNDSQKNQIQQQREQQAVNSQQQQQFIKRLKNSVPKYKPLEPKRKEQMKDYKRLIKKIPESQLRGQHLRKQVETKNREKDFKQFQKEGLKKNTEKQVDKIQEVGIERLFKSKQPQYIYTVEDWRTFYPIEHQDFKIAYLLKLNLHFSDKDRGNRNSFNQNQQVYIIGAIFHDNSTIVRRFVKNNQLKQKQTIKQYQKSSKKTNIHKNKPKQTRSKQKAQVRSFSTKNTNIGSYSKNDKNIKDQAQSSFLSNVLTIYFPNTQILPSEKQLQKQFLSNDNYRKEFQQIQDNNQSENLCFLCQTQYHKLPDTNEKRFLQDKQLIKSYFNYEALLTKKQDKFQLQQQTINKSSFSRKYKLLNFGNKSLVEQLIFENRFDLLINDKFRNFGTICDYFMKKINSHNSYKSKTYQNQQTKNEEIHFMRKKRLSLIEQSECKEQFGEEITSQIEVQNKNITKINTKEKLSKIAVIRCFTSDRQSLDQNHILFQLTDGSRHYFQKPKKNRTIQNWLLSYDTQLSQYQKNMSYSQHIIYLSEIRQGYIYDKTKNSYLKISRQQVNESCTRKHIIDPLWREYPANKNNIFSISYDKKECSYNLNPQTQLQEQQKIAQKKHKQKQDQNKNIKLYSQYMLPSVWCIFNYNNKLNFGIRQQSKYYQKQISI